jgi:hypothetical protein
MQYKCLKNSIEGRKGEIITLTDSVNTKGLLKMGIVAPHKPESKKGGKTVKDVDPKAETKAETKTLKLNKKAD